MKINQFNKTLLILLFTLTSLNAQILNKAYLDYIANYHKQAMIEKNKFGIPASITLAQGLLESGAGKSTLAVTANNHFGIKCIDWKGDKTYKDDDAKDECFRKYNTVLESYEDHSLFIKNKPRYASLFNLSPNDYQGWAHGLKKAGYATDPTYAYKLISIIEGYELQKYDNDNNISASNSVIENNKNSKQIDKIDAFQAHKIYKNNKVKYIIAEYNDSYGSIADEQNMDEKRLRNFNDVNSTTELHAGDKVYLQTKKRIASKENSFHDVVEGETLYAISQKYAIQLLNLYLMNDIPLDQGAKVGQQLKLRK